MMPEFMSYVTASAIVLRFPIRSTIGSLKRPRARKTTVSCSRGRILAPDLLTHSGWGFQGPVSTQRRQANIFRLSGVVRFRSHEV
jgi:hypothetical protein